MAPRKPSARTTPARRTRRTRSRRSNTKLMIDPNERSAARKRTIGSRKKTRATSPKSAPKTRRRRRRTTSATRAMWG